MECRNCGNPVRPEATYCPRCGARQDEAAPPPGEAVVDADLSTVELTLLEKLRRARLTADAREGTAIATGIAGLVIERRDAEVVALAEPGPGGAFRGSVEIVATLDHPAFGHAVIADRSSALGESAEAALAACADSFMTVTFSGLRSLFQGGFPGAPHRESSSEYPLGANGSAWELHNGHLQILGEAKTAVQMRLRKPPPHALVLDALNDHLGERRLHWCKVDAANRPPGGLVVEVTIDGSRSSRAESELRRKLLERGEIAGKWEFRQFFVLGPASG